jgi:hypothetical protein
VESPVWGWPALASVSPGKCEGAVGQTRDGNRRYSNPHMPAPIRGYMRPTAAVSGPTRGVHDGGSFDTRSRVPVASFDTDARSAEDNSLPRCQNVGLLGFVGVPRIWAVPT